MASQKQIAAHLDLSERHVRTLAKDGVLPIGRGRNAMDFDECRTAYIRHLREQRDHSRNRAPEPLESERALLTRAQREGQELRNAQTRRELAPIDLIGWTLSKVASQIVAILDALPLKIKNIAPRFSAAEIEHIRREIVKAQNAAASVGIDLDEYYEAHATKRPAHLTTEG